VSDHRSNWRSALETYAVAIELRDLIRIGVVLGPDVAERVYLSLREEPRTAHGVRIDWLSIHEEILRLAPRDRYGMSA
jgi:hypothetical protein